MSDPTTTSSTITTSHSCTTGTINANTTLSISPWLLFTTTNTTTSTNYLSSSLMLLY